MEASPNVAIPAAARGRRARRPRRVARALAGAAAVAAALGCDSREPRAPGRFRDVAAERGLDVSLDRAEPGRYFMPDSMAGGAAFLDADGDGDLDVLLAHGVWRAGAAAAGGLARLFLQEPSGRFRDAGAEAGVTGAAYALGIATGDADNDGDVDLYLACFGQDRFLVNRGDGTFDDRTREAGIADVVGTSAFGASCTFADYDADGRLDLYVTNYVAFEAGDESRDARGEPEFPAPGNYDGVADVLLRNRGDGTFEDVSALSGIGAGRGRGLGVAAGDWNSDGRVDFYVANDGQANHCWIQTEGGRFEERAFDLGLALSGDGRPEAGMGVARGDVDDDGREDFLVTHLTQETHTLYVSGDDGRYADRTLQAGLAAPTVDLTGFGAALTDVDLDGRLDLVVVHGRVLRGRVLAGAAEAPRWRPYAEPGLLFLGEERRFRVADAGELGARIETGRGLAAGDFDGDGDVDLLVTTAAGAVRLYEQRGAPEHLWLAVRAVDDSLGGRDVLGAEVHVEHGGRRQWRTVQTCHGYLSASEPAARFGLGGANGAAEAAVARVTVRWPDGRREEFGPLASNRLHVVRRGTGR